MINKNKEPDLLHELAKILYPAKPRPVYKNTKGEEVGYICAPCGRELTKREVENMVTWHKSRCDNCNRLRWLCHITDFLPSGIEFD